MVFEIEIIHHLNVRVIFCHDCCISLPFGNRFDFCRHIVSEYFKNIEKKTEKGKQHKDLFVTDNRDLEMMLFAAPSVVSEMEMWASGFSQAWQRVVPVARHLGYVRICNHVNDYSCIIRATVKPGKLWDYNTHDFNPDWQSICSSALEEVISKAELDVFIEENSLSYVSTYDICRGHDVVNLLSLALVRKEFTSKAITNKIIEAYAIEDFQRTNLYTDLLIWQRNRGVTVLA